MIHNFNSFSELMLFSVASILHKNPIAFNSSFSSPESIELITLLILNYSVVRNTRNPVYDEDFTFYGLSMVEISAMSLHFVVLSFDRYSRDDVIGEVILPLNEIDLNQIETQQVAMCKEIQPRSLKVVS